MAISYRLNMRCRLLREGLYDKNPYDELCCQGFCLFHWVRAYPLCDCSANDVKIILANGPEQSIPIGRRDIASSSTNSLNVANFGNSATANDDVHSQENVSFA